MITDDCIIDKKMTFLKKLCSTTTLYNVKAKKNNIKYISEKDIWLVISKFKWQKQKDLTLADIVDDILNTDNSKLLSMYHLYYRKDEDALELPKLKNNE